ncbi:MAG: alpha-amylase family glycosyl hydrolase [Omnitrophica WOR_2 bacterium]
MTQAAIYGDVYLSEEDRYLRFGNACIELVFSRRNGNWVGLLDRQSSLWLAPVNDHEIPTLLLRVGGKLKQSGIVRNSRVYDLIGNQEIGRETQYRRHSIVCSENLVSLEIETEQGDWIITSQYYLSSQDATIARGLKLLYLGEQELLLRDVRFITPFFAISGEEDTWIEAPDYPVTAHFPLNQVATGSWEALNSRPSSDPEIVQHSVDTPGSIAGVVALHHPRLETSVLCWPHSTSEFCIMEAEKKLERLSFVQWQFLADRFQKGHALEAGAQYVRIDHGSWEQALQHYQAWYEKIGLTAPLDRSAWSDGTAIYEVHTGRAPFLGGRSYEPYSEMKDLVDDLPRIKSLGFEVIQLMPHWPFCGYTVHNYHQIDRQYGDETELKRLVHTAHSLGMKVILDIVLHGCVDKEIVRLDMQAFGPRFDFIFGEWLKAADEKATYRSEHPEWFIQDEQGQTAKIYTWAFDHSNLSFQNFIIGVLKFYLAEFEVDGFRFDAPTWNCVPNWAPGLPYRASASYYAAYHLMTRARKEIKQYYPEALFYTEPSGPLFRETMDLTYNYDEEWLSGSLVDIVSERGFAGARIYNGKRLTAREVAEWLHYRSLSLPAGSVTVHHLDSHDTYWWGEKAQFRSEAFGPAAARALFAFYALIGGGLMNYVGSESGSETFYSRLVNLRQKTAALRYGDCDYLAIKADPDTILPLLRSYREEHIIPVINLGKQDACAVLQIPAARLGLKITDHCLVFDIFNNEYIQPSGERRLPVGELDHLNVPVAAFGVRLLQVYPIQPRNTENLPAPE